MRAVALAMLCLVIVGCSDDDPGLTYPWDDRKVICSLAVDDVGQPAQWDRIEREMARAEANGSVLMLHAHVPGVTMTMNAIDRVLSMAQMHHLAFLTYRELEAGATPRAGFALAFDDAEIDAWFSARDVLGAHSAHVTYFVTYWGSRTADQRVELRTLADDGDDVEPHSVNHLAAPAYVAEHGLDAYLADEVIPSIDGLVAAGYPRAAIFAYPGGATTDEINDAVLQVVPRVRVSPGSCPY